MHRRIIPEEREREIKMSVCVYIDTYNVTEVIKKIANKLD